MCGIIGVIGHADAAPAIMEGLKRLEYRGYDSAGVAVLGKAGMQRCRQKGKLSGLMAMLAKKPLRGATGIGHTRWATHGKPDTANAHPHIVGKVALVHNGIIENFADLKRGLEKSARPAGGDKKPSVSFASDTDSEVIAHLIANFLADGADPIGAFIQTLEKLQGAFSLAVIIDGYPDMILAARRGSPLAIGYGDGEMYLASDALGLGHVSRKICYLEDGDWAILRRDGVEITDKSGQAARRSIMPITGDSALVSKDGFKHFMHKEIHQQPVAVAETLASCIDFATGRLTLPPLPFDPAKHHRMAFVACGTSFYAAQVARYWLEEWAGIAVSVDYASEFRYRAPVLDRDTPLVVLSQSGETADTLAALDYARAAKCRTVAIVNVEQSSIARMADLVLPTHAGPEISVASTKAFTTQLAVLACFAVVCARARGKITPVREKTMIGTLMEVPAHMTRLLRRESDLQSMAGALAKARSVFYLGRGSGYPLAREGALKLKEVSYIHAEAHPAGEMKHGPIALIEEGSVVIVIAPGGPLFAKLSSNVEEVIARGARAMILSDRPTMSGPNVDVWSMPTLAPIAIPFLYSLPIQLIAYHTALARGTDVDQPRNLAKAVTVE